MSNVNKSFSANVQANVNAGFSSKKPANAGEIIDSPFEVVKVVTKKDGNGVESTYVIVVIHPAEDQAVVTRVFNASDLLGMEVNPCHLEDDQYVIDDEGFTVTWEDELIFNAA